MDNFLTLHETLGSLCATLIFAAALYAPGFAVSYASNLFGFRKLSATERSCWAIAISFLVAPILADLLCRVAGLTAVTVTVGLASIFCIVHLLRTWREHCSARHFEAGGGSGKRGLWIFFGWTVFCLLMLVDFQIGHRLYFSVVTADQSYRIAFTDAVVRTGVPPSNPLYSPGGVMQSGSHASLHVTAMPYYYFWYVLCAVVVKLGRLAHVTSQQAFIASSVWAGIGLMATVHLFTQHFFRWTGSRSHRLRWLALALLTVTGADLIPALGNLVLQASLNGDIEWWSVDPIDSWANSLLWVPHHVAGTLCCLLAFLLLWRTREALSCKNRFTALLLAATGCASAFGLSCYVMFGFVLMMAAWFVRLVLIGTPDRLALWKRSAFGAIVASTLLFPFLLELVHGLRLAATGETGTHLFSFSVRRMIDSGLLTGLPIFAGWNQKHPVILDQGLRMLLLVPGLALELGVYGAVLVILCVQRWRKRVHGARPDLQAGGEASDTAFFFVVCGLTMTMFLSSSVISNNDFGYRAVMLPQFFLVLLTAEWLGAWWFGHHQSATGIQPRRGQRQLLYGLLGLGVAGSVYGALLLRAWLPLEQQRSQDGFGDLSQDAAAVHAAFQRLHSVASPGAVIAFRPIPPEAHQRDEVMTPNEFYQRMLVMNAGRQVVNAEWQCAVHFGGDPAGCRTILQTLDALYASPSPGARQAQELCKKLGVQYLAISHRDPSWRGSEAHGSGWPETLPTVAQQPGFRLLACSADGNAQQTSPSTSTSSHLLSWLKPWHF